jgi:hypothetical protein
MVPSLRSRSLTLEESVLASGGVHLVTGFAIGSRCPSIPAAFLAGIASHAALDAVPHHDYRHVAAHGGDAALGLFLTTTLWGRCRRKRRKAGLAGAVGAILPDIESALLFLGRMDKGRMRFPSHSGLIRHGQAGYLDTYILYSLLLAASWALVSHDRVDLSPRSRVHADNHVASKPVA